MQNSFKEKLNNEDLGKIQSFHSTVQEIGASTFVKNILDRNKDIEFEWTEKDGAKMLGIKNFNSELFRSFLISARKIWMQGSDSHINKVLNILSKITSSNSCQNKSVEVLKTELKSIKQKHIYKIQMNGHEEEYDVIDLFLHGGIFHSGTVSEDKKKTDKLNFLLFVDPYVGQQFVGAFHDLAILFLETDNKIGEIFASKDS